MDKFTEVTEISWLSRLRNALAALVFGSLFLLIGFIMLRNGEKMHAKITSGLQRTLPEIVAAPQAQNNEIFYLTDSIKASKFLLVDSSFNIQAKGLKLYRKVYTWQWFEQKTQKNTRRPLGGTKRETTYIYNKGWVSNFCSQSESKTPQDFNYNFASFKHKEGHTNPKQIYTSTLVDIDNQATIQSYTIAPKLYNAVNDFTLLDLSQKKLDKGILDTFNYAKTPWYNGFDITDDYSCGKKAPVSRGTKTSSIFLGKGSPEAPLVGDTRIEYWYVPENVYTVVGLKNKNTIETFEDDSLFIRAADHSLAIGDFGLVFKGKKELAEITQDLHNESNFAFILFRFCGLLFIIGGCAIYTNPIKILFSWLPFIGSVWEAVVFKLTLVLGSFVAICISGFYFLKYNSVSNLSIYDFYFLVAVVLFILFTKNLSAFVNDNTVYDSSR